MIANFINFISENLLLIQFLSLFISGILLFFSIYFLVKTGIVGQDIEHYIGVFTSKDICKRRSLMAWKQIQKRLKTGKADRLKLAILEADRILNEILKMAGYPGKNLDERLEQADSAQISNIEELRQAHKLKNRLVSEPDFVITRNEAEIIIDIYKKALQELNLIE